MKQFFEVHDDMTNKTLNIEAYTLDQAIEISEDIDYETAVDGDYVLLSKRLITDIPEEWRNNIGTISLEIFANGENSDRAFAEFVTALEKLNESAKNYQIYIPNQEH